jgi:hypothetical protein
MAVHNPLRSRYKEEKETYHKTLDIISGLFDVSEWCRLVTLGHANTSCLSPLAPLEHARVDLAVQL